MKVVDISGRGEETRCNRCTSSWLNSVHDVRIKNIRGSWDGFRGKVSLGVIPEFDLQIDGGNHFESRLQVCCSENLFMLKCELINSLLISFGCSCFHSSLALPLVRHSYSQG